MSTWFKNRRNRRKDLVAESVTEDDEDDEEDQMESDTENDDGAKSRLGKALQKMKLEAKN